MPRVIAVDGPAGAGKSTSSRALAARLGFACVDSGAMYRAVGVLARAREVSLEDEKALAALAAGLHFAAAGDRLLVDDCDLSEAIRLPEAGELASRVSACPAVRARLVALQRQLGDSGDVVMEGRDIGTVVFPDAAVKFFLTAEPAARARRRARELGARGQMIDAAVLARELAARDHRDSTRAIAPLRPARDAVVLDTTGRSLEEVVSEMERIARSRLG